MYLYYKTLETDGYLHTLRIETRPDHYAQFQEILGMIVESKSNRICKL